MAEAATNSPKHSTHCEVGFWAKYFILARVFLASSPWSCVFHEYNSNQYFRFAHIKMGGAQICTLFNQTVTEKNWQQTTMINIWNCKAPKMCGVYKTSVLTLWYTVGWGTVFLFLFRKKTILDHFQTHYQFSKKVYCRIDPYIPSLTAACIANTYVPVYTIYTRGSTWVV